MAGERIPISKGFSISFSADGRALNHGKAWSEALEAVEEWMAANPSHPSRGVAGAWLQQAQNQLKEDRQLQEIRAKRQDINALADRVERESRVKLPKELYELSRDAAFKAKGVPRYEE